MKADGSNITADDLFAIYARVIDPVDMYTCPVCNKKAANSICAGQRIVMAYLLDMYVRIVILLPWKKGYDGELYHEDEYEKLEKEKENDIYENI